MANLQAIKDTASEQRLFFNRLLLATVCVVLGIGAVLARIAQLQIFEFETYSDLAQGNRIRLEAAPPTRGLILDRNGVVLAQNLPAYQLEMIPEQVPDIDDALEQLFEIGLLDRERETRIRDRIARTPSFNPVTLRARMDDAAIAEFALLRPYFQGIDIRARLVRDYPHGNSAAHILGYVGGLSESDLQSVDASNYVGTTQIGKTGIEATYEKVLHGHVGHLEVTTNADGRAVDFQTRDEPQPGQHVYLTIDLELQRIAEQALVGKRGAVVAIEPSSGEILALVSAPAFDPNAFAQGMDSATFGALQDDLDRPLFNRAIAGGYPPGSTIKPILGLGALDAGRTSINRVTNCEGHFSLPGSTHRYRDWKPEGHGLVDLTQAIAQSCDVYFYQLAQDMDIDLMHDYLVQFGLGSLLGIEIPGEKPGLVPSRDWKRGRFSRRADQVWFPGETVIASIGQGYMTATPLQLAHVAATLANFGMRVQPRLTLQIEDPLNAETLLEEPVMLDRVEDIDSHAWQHIVDAMLAVLQTPQGSAYATGRDIDYRIAGKSGTAQVFSVAQEDEYDELELDERLKDHALFIAFAPIEAPEIAVAVVIENAESGSSVAAPVARQLADFWLKR
ncbi:MAG: penicillin-binding protein 2 [Pseudomonadota bacterium]